MILPEDTPTSRSNDSSLRVTGFGSGRTASALHDARPSVNTIQQFTVDSTGIVKGHSHASHANALLSYSKADKRQTNKAKLDAETLR
uniref:Uncharacterized protein n=1 Tax=Vespula pensylvanica TaxID=30213 RepID=A0A834PDH8_VESPE|nr:hypothetical protein H0235_000025 [Vespula pensylvanica]